MSEQTFDRLFDYFITPIMYLMDVLLCVVCLVGCCKQTISWWFSPVIITILFGNIGGIIVMIHDWIKSHKQNASENEEVHE